jgi:hyperosmotically inducible periplasmic protein
MSPRPLVMSFAMSALLFTAQQLSAQSTQDGATSASSMSTSMDNTSRNRLDPTHANADTQKNDKEDLRLTQTIRKHVMADKSLSVYAHNVKIVAVNGNVTLNGVVHTDAERTAIETQAVSVAGKDHVVNELKVAPAQ